MIESPIENWVIDKAGQHGWFARKMAWRGRNGAPDDFFAKDGRIVLIEMKRPGGKARPGQKKEHEALKAAGVEVHVCDNPLAALRILGVPSA